MLVSVSDYQSITGDETSATGVVEPALRDAQALLESALGRGLELAERTERVKVFPDGAAYPSVTPIVAVPSGHSVQGVAVLGVGPTSFVAPADAKRSLTYTGGFDPDETDRSAATFLPTELARAIAWAAKALVTPADGWDVPAGATSISVGDVSVSFGAGGSPASGEIRFGAGLVSRWRRRRDMAA